MIGRRSLLYLLTAGVLPGACGGSAVATATGPSATAPTSVRRVVVLGDSLAVSPSMAEAFPAHLQHMIDRHGLPWTVVNAGVSGDTTAGGVRRVEGLLTRDVGALVVALGANDGLRGLSTDAVSRNLSVIIETAQASGIAVLLCGMETLPTKGWEYLLAFHRVFPDLASKHGVPLVPFLLSGVALVPEMNGSDGFHPNATGARRIAENVWPSLEPLLRASAARANAFI
jgi:acyl-CoA thioesterase I